MTLAEFRTAVKTELQYGDKRVAYMYKKDNLFIGGMCKTREEALFYCKKAYLEYGSDVLDFNIAIYNEDDIDILGNYEVLLALSLISNEEYQNSSNDDNFPILQ